MIFGLAEWLFWTLVALLFVVLATCTEAGWGGVATTILVLLAGLVCYLTHTNPLVWIGSNPGSLLVYLIGYFVAGAAYSVFKWWRWVTWRAKKYASIAPQSYQRELYGKPKVTSEGGRLLGWMVAWPVSGFWTLVNDPVRHVFEVLRDWLKNVYQSIADHAYEGL